MKSTGPLAAAKGPVLIFRSASAQGTVETDDSNGTAGDIFLVCPDIPEGPEGYIDKIQIALFFGTPCHFHFRSCYVQDQAICFHRQ